MNFIIACLLISTVVCNVTSQHFSRWCNNTNHEAEVKTVSGLNEQMKIVHPIVVTPDFLRIFVCDPKGQRELQNYWKTETKVPETTPFPLTSFTCHGRLPGYYADLETGCKTYHVCDGNSHFTYVCPRRTLFQQRSRICDHSYLVNCEDSPHFYEAEDVYPEDEEEVLLRLAESEEDLPSKEEIAEDDVEEEEFVPTETTDESTEISVPPTSSNRTTATTTTPTESEVVQSKESFSSQSIQKFLKIRLKDVRSLFFIPEVEENAIATNPEREFLLPVEKSDFMKFKNRANAFKTFSLCPAYCNPKFFQPDSCHPCIMIK